MRLENRDGFVRAMGQVVKGAVVAAALAALAGAPAAASDGRLSSLWRTPDAEMPPIVWSGFYVRPDIGFDTFKFTGAARSSYRDLEGFGIGGQIGYDHQVGNIVFGALTEGVFSFADADPRGGGPGDADVESFGTVRARLGAAFGRWMLYGTGGAAFARLDLSDGLASQTKTLSGWVAGGGVEYMWWPNSAIRFEYLRVELEKERFGAIGTTAGLEANVFNFGFVRKF